jgi:hypothetical protein
MTTTAFSTVPRIDAGQFFRLPWTAADNAMTWLEPTRKCNITCDACFAANDAQSEKTLDQIRHEIDTMLRLRRCDAMLIAGGEPLTHPQIVEVVSIVKQAGVKPVLITNGVGLNSHLVHELRQAGLHGCTFHVDRHQMRPGWQGKSERELNDLRMQFADMLKAEGKLTCSFNTTIFPDSLAEVPDIVAWVVRHPDKVQILTLICVRTADMNGPYEYYVGNQPVDFSKTPYVGTEPYENLTTEQIYAQIQKVLPDFEFCAFLGGTVHPNSLKWVIGSHICSTRRSFGNIGARTMELFQNGYHMFTRRYLAYVHPRESGRGLLTLFLAPIDRAVRKTTRRFIMAVLRNPSELMRRLYVQSVSVVQPVDILPNGELDTCDGCPNKTFWQDRLVSACRLEEYKMFGGPVHLVPRAH